MSEGLDLTGAFTKIMAAADSYSSLKAAINQTGSMLLLGGYGYGNVGNCSPFTGGQHHDI